MLGYQRRDKGRNFKLQSTIAGVASFCPIQVDLVFLAKLGKLSIAFYRRFYVGAINETQAWINSIRFTTGISKSGTQNALHDVIHFSHVNGISVVFAFNSGKLVASSRVFEGENAINLTAISDSNVLADVCAKWDFSVESGEEINDRLGFWAISHRKNRIQYRET